MAVSLTTISDLLGRVEALRAAQQRVAGRDRSPGELLDELRLARERQLRDNASTPPIHLLAAAGWQTDERIHCRLLRWLLDPQGSHAQGPIFLSALLDILGLHPQGLGSSVVTAEVQRDDTRIDVEVVVPGHLLLHVEAKIDAPDGYEQPRREAALLAQRANETGIDKALGVYLTRDGESNGQFEPMTWLELARALEPGLERTTSRDAHILLRHVINCFKSLTTRDYSMGSDTSKLDRLILSRWEDVAALLADVDRLEGRICEVLTEKAFRTALKEQGFGASWDLDVSTRGVPCVTLHPPAFHQTRDWWTCFNAENISLSALLAGEPEKRPRIGIWWYSLRQALSDRALLALQATIEQLADGTLRGTRPLRRPTKDEPVWWPLDADLTRKPELLADLPRVIVREWKLLLPFVPAITKASKAVRR